eukprot:SAG11_NODE_16636_length_542_cov_0.652370_2_plen_21_part_01
MFCVQADHTLRPASRSPVDFY